MIALFLIIVAAIVAALLCLPLIARLAVGILRALIPLSILIGLALFGIVAYSFLSGASHEIIEPVWHRIEAIFEKGFTARYQRMSGIAE